MGERTIATKRGSIWDRLFGRRDSVETEATTQETEYKGYRIQPAPYRQGGQYQTAGVIRKAFPDGVKEHRFVRAETHAAREDAEAFAVTKARQIIDEQGDRLFADP